MNHKLRVLFYVLLAVVIALIATGEQPSLAEGTIIYVDADARGANNGSSWKKAYRDLQDALDEAIAGDQIWVAEGIYTPTIENIPGDPRSASFQMKPGVAIYGGFTGKEHNLAGRNWQVKITILSGDLNGDDEPNFLNNSENSYHVIYNPSSLALDSSAILDGFTIQGGNANAASPNNLGGGIFNEGSSPKLANCTFTGNAATYGGGMANYSSSPSLTNCAFTHNTANDGGGMYNWYTATPSLTNCVFAENYAYWGGGGMYNINSASANLTNCIFESNEAGISGGGIFNDFSLPVLTNCTLWGNSANYGGGIYSINYASPMLTNCTFSGNSAGTSGGGMYSYYYSSPTVTNSILWGDSSPEIGNNYGSTTSVNYSNVQGGYYGTANISLDPFFVDAVQGDLHLGRGSPCIDSGSNSAPYLPAHDFEGDDRILDGNGDEIATVDMGVDELDEIYPPMVIFVDQDATGASNGTSWRDAFTNLQPALDTAVNGDQIWVAAGIYTPTREYTPGDPRSSTWQMKNGVALYGGFAGNESSLEERDWVTNATILSGDLKGDDGPDFTNNAENSYHVFYHPFGVNLNESAILDGFVITGGNANGAYPDNAGGGMYNVASMPSLANCTFQYNSGFYGGGLATIYGSNLSLTDCIFDGNAASVEGGGMYGNSSPTLINVTFSNNTANNAGGGMNYGYASPVLIHCTFTGNTAGSGGGMSISDGSAPILTECKFEGNSAGDLGGGLYSSSSSPLLTNCIFSNNSAYKGGGMVNIISSPTISNTTFDGNSATAGGGIYNHNGSTPILTNTLLKNNSAVLGGAINNDTASPVLTNCTLWGNSSTNMGGGIYNAYNSSPVVTNTILWNNAPDEIYTADTYSNPVITYSDVQGGYTGAGNIDADPLFIDASTGDFHLSAGSPAIDVGENTARNLPQYDFEGDNRIMDGDSNGMAIVDMGVDEVEGEIHLPGVIFVDMEATGANSGTSWVDAFTELQPALVAAVAGDQIWVAAGIYKPVAEHGGSGDRYKSFQMRNDIAIYGGFDPSLGYTDWENRDWASNLTIISGDIGIQGDNADNSYHVFYHPENIALNNSAILDGFTITGGNANGSSPQNLGGGMYNYQSTPTISNCIFSGNTADNGGGMYNGQGSSLVITNSSFVGNSARFGGGMYNLHSSPTLTSIIFSSNTATSTGGGLVNESNAIPTIEYCTFSGNSANVGGGIYNSVSNISLSECSFSGNSANDSGGGIYNDYSSPLISNSSFTGNSAIKGGGVYNHNASSPVLTNCVFSGNSADNGGGMFNVNEASPVLTNCTFTHNSADQGGGMYNQAYPAPIITNSIMWGDTPNEISSDLGASPRVTFSDVQGGYVGEGNIDADPLFIDPTNNDFHLSLGSPIIDAGNNSAQNLPAFDFEGDPRILDGNGDGTAIVDMGVDEYNPDSVARLEDALNPITSQEQYKPELARFTGGFIAILAAIGINVAIPALARKRSARNMPR